MATTHAHQKTRNNDMTLKVGKVVTNTPKQWKSFQEQLEILKSNGLIVDNNASALDYLERIGYYRLSGYWYPFRKMKAKPDKFSYREDDFMSGSRFEDAVRLYVFDKKLRLLALDALERIELSVRVDIAYLLGKNDVFAHEEPSLFHDSFSKVTIKKGRCKGKTKHKVWLSKYKRLESQAKHEAFVQHNIDKYQKLPIWVAIEIWNFGTLSHLYGGMNVKDKNIIAEKYGLIKGNDLRDWLRSLNFIRNVSAHHSRLWNVNIIDRSPVPNFDDNWEILKNSKPFLYFCMMQKMMRVICPNSTWGLRFKELIGEFPNIAINNVPQNEQEYFVTLQEFGMPENWDDWDLWD